MKPAGANIVIKTNAILHNFSAKRLVSTYIARFISFSDPENTTQK